MLRRRSDSGGPDSGDRELLSRRLRTHQLGALALACVGLILGLVMVPKGDELLVMRVKGRNLPEAQRLLDEARDLSSRASVVAYGDVHLQLGDVDAALSTLETYVAGVPDDADAWERLATYYRQAQRLFDYVGALEQVQRLRPTPEVARELATRYLWIGDSRRELATLRTLMDAGVADEAEYVRAARLAASTGELGTAASILHRLAQRAPEAFEIDTVDLWANVLVDLGRAEQVQPLIGSLPAVRHDATVLAGLAGLLRQQGHEDAALALLDDPSPELDAGALRLARLQAEIGLGNTARAFEEAKQLLLEGNLPPEGRLLLIESALSEGHIDEAWAVAEMVGIRQLPRWLRAKFIVVELDRGNQAGALVALERVGDDSLEESPLLAAELSLASGNNTKAASWVTAFAGHASPSPAQVVQVASLERRLGLTPQAYERLRGLVASGMPDQDDDVRAWALATFVEVARDAGRLDDALAALEATALKETEEGRTAWVRLAARTASDRLMAWLASAPSLSRDLLEEIYFIRMDAGDFPAAHDVATALQRQFPEPKHALMVGRTQLAMGQVEAAVALLREAETEPEARELLETALVEAHRAGYDHAVEIRDRLATALPDAHERPERVAFLVESLLGVGGEGEAFEWLPALVRLSPERWTAAFKDAAIALNRTTELHEWLLDELSNGRPSPEVRALYAHVLLDTHAPDARLVPVLADLAEHDRTWNFPYDEVLERLGAVNERIALWSREAHRPASSTEERRAAAFRLAALGAKAEAISAFRAVASTDPTDPALGQLLFLWGPRPPAEATDWLAAQLARAVESERAGWIGHLVNSGAGNRVLELMPSWPVDHTAPVRLAWLSAARTVQATSAIGDGLVRELLTYPDPERARFVGTTALELGFSRIALDAWAVVAAAAQDDRDAHRWVGTLTFYEGDLELAEPYLVRYVALGGAEPEPVYQLGEVRRSTGDAAEADRHFRRVVDGIDAMAAPSFFLTNLRANALSRLGERDEAREAFEQLLALDPEADDVRADYAALLMEWGDLAHAQHVLVIR